MKVLVTGGAGYIGSVTAEGLVRAGHEVVVFDNLSHGHRAAVPSKAEFVHGDLLEPADISSAILRARPEAVLHFAGNIEVGESMRDPLKYLGDNVISGIHLLRASIAGDVRRFILSSTANLFDRPERIPIDETAEHHPGSPYGESKLALERTLAWMERIHGLQWCSLRYFNAAGATEERGEDHRPESHLIPLVLQVAAGRREKISVFGSDYDTPDGTCIRDYIHVSDLADAHLLALASSGKGSRVYNLGNGSGYSVKEVIETAQRVTGRPIPAEVVPRRAGDVARLVADSTLLRQELGWTPRFPQLARIIESAWRWMQKHPEGYRD